MRSLRTCLRISFLGDERQRLWGSLDGKPALAPLDTRSDDMLVSAEWAKENSLNIDRDPEHRLELELTDGSRVLTTGVVYDTTWTLGIRCRMSRATFMSLATSWWMLC